MRRPPGMDRDQAEGLARAIGNEPGGHVTARGDLETFRSGVDSSEYVSERVADGGIARPLRPVACAWHGRSRW